MSAVAVRLLRLPHSALVMLIRIALVGDHDPSVIAHRAIPIALDLAAQAIETPVLPEWLATDAISRDSDLDGYHAIWVVPASPYRNMDGALRAIRVARETRRPFLGTCGGFQHGVIEYARHVLGWADADHAETAPEGRRTVIAPLACSLVEISGGVRFQPGSRLAAAYGVTEAREGYHCNYGLNPAFRDAIAAGALRVTAEDAEGDVRALELDDHPFYVMTLFQPERAALEVRVPPIVREFVRAAGEVGRRG